MKMACKVFLGIGAGVLVIGLVVMLIGLGLNGWSFKVDYEMQSYTQEEDCKVLDLSLAAGEMNVEFYYGDKIEVSYPNSYKYGYEVSEKNGTLTVAPKQSFGFWFGFGWNKIPAVTVKIPNITQNAVNLYLKVSAGKATIDYGFFKSVKLSLSAGVVNMGKIICDDFDANVSAGSATVNSLTCSRSVTSDVSAGSLNLGNIACDKITTHVSAGSANFAVAGKKGEYYIYVDKSAGDCNVTGKYGTDPNKALRISLSAGTCIVTFTG